MNLYPIDLYTLIKRGGIEPTILKKYLFQILKGLEYLGTLNIAHRDLKPHNILIDPSTNQAVVCDFGSAKRLVEGEENIAYICARCYRAPELVLGATEYTTAIDMWSFGCIVAEILNKKPFFIGDSNIEQFIKILVVLGTPKKEELNEMNSNT
jgi:serine/threonine protein kinase